MTRETPKDTAHIATVGELQERVEEIERCYVTQAANSVNWKHGLGRIKTLEARFSSVPVAREELRRQDRWHETRDAILPYCADLAHDAHRSRSEVADDALQRAAEFADRAHGPLEAAFAGVLSDTVQTLQTTERTCGPMPHQLQRTYPAVAELVRALTMFREAFDKSEVDWGSPAARASIAADDALEPFEAPEHE